MLEPALLHAIERLPTVNVRLDPKVYDQTLTEPSLNLLKTLAPFHTNEMLNTIEPVIKRIISDSFTEQIENFSRNVAASIAPPTIEIPITLRPEIVDMARSAFVEQTMNLNQAVSDAVRPPTAAVIAQFMLDIRPQIVAQFDSVARQFYTRLTPIQLPAPPPLVPFTLPSPFPMALTTDSQNTLATATSDRIANNPGTIPAETARVVLIDLLPTVRELVKDEMETLRKDVLDLVRDRLPPPGEMASMYAVLRGAPSVATQLAQASATSPSPGAQAQRFESFGEDDGEPYQAIESVDNAREAELAAESDQPMAPPASTRVEVPSVLAQEIPDQLQTLGLPIPDSLAAATAQISLTGAAPAVIAAVTQMHVSAVVPVPLPRATVAPVLALPAVLPVVASVSSPVLSALSAEAAEEALAQSPTQLAVRDANLSSISIPEGLQQELSMSLLGPSGSHIDLSIFGRPERPSSSENGAPAELSGTETAADTSEIFVGPRVQAVRNSSSSDEGAEYATPMGDIPASRSVADIHSTLFGDVSAAPPARESESEMESEPGTATSDPTGVHAARSHARGTTPFGPVQLRKRAPRDAPSPSPPVSKRGRAIERVLVGHGHRTMRIVDSPEPQTAEGTLQQTA